MASSATHRDIHKAVIDNSPKIEARRKCPPWRFSLAKCSFAQRCDSTRDPRSLYVLAKYTARRTADLREREGTEGHTLTEKAADREQTKDTTFHQSRAGGVRVESAFPYTAGRKTDPIIFIHGGCHGSWVFHNYLSFFAESGWEGHALNWFNHNGSKSLSPERFIARGIEDIKEEIGVVVSTLGVAPILVAHSMGGIAAQKFAEENDVRALILIAPVVPIEAGVDSIDLAIEEGQVWPVPPFGVARRLFFDGLDNDQSEYFYSLLCSESPRCVYEATRFTVSVNYKNIKCPILALGAEHDLLVPPGYVRALAELSRAEFRLVLGRGHNLLLEPNWRVTAGIIRDWLIEKSL